jgi:hypothetical protein
MNVTYPGSPHGSRQSGPVHVNNTYTVTGEAFIENDVLLFEFENDRGDAVTVRVNLTDDQNNGPLAVGSVSWASGDTSLQYIEFSEFPLRFSGDVMDTCNYEASLTNDADENEGTEIWMNIYRG